MRTDPSTQSTTVPVRSKDGTSDIRDHTVLLIDAKTAATMLALGARTLWANTNCQATPFHRIGRAVCDSPDESLAWVARGCPAAPRAADRDRKGVRL